MSKKKPSWKVWIKVRQNEDPKGWGTPDPIGSMLDWDDPYFTDSTGLYGWSKDKGGQYEPREPFEFNAILKFEGFYRGRSAAGFYLIGPKGEKYVMRLKEIDNLIKNAEIYKGNVTGRWGFTKQGANYSLTYLGGKE